MLCLVSHWIKVSGPQRGNRQNEPDVRHVCEVWPDLQKGQHVRVKGLRYGGDHLDIGYQMSLIYRCFLQLLLDYSKVFPGQSRDPPASEPPAQPSSSCLCRWFHAESLARKFGVV
ncbi:hypothetical protein WMY93_002993 [Mugilogobius chulae]|uniref:Galectin n=1 Tax=Mugilogobius chulae TaxID=88201 RepID=A0AAW0Q575_9GOBI